MKLTISTFTFLLVICGLSYSQNGFDSQHEKQAIKQVIQKSYIDVLYGDKAIENIKDGFHEEFNMYVYYKNQFSKRSLSEWIERLMTNAAKESDSVKPEYSVEFALIDVTGQTGVVKLNIFENQKQKYTDYLTLYKFEEGWKVITKQFTIH